MDISKFLEGGSDSAWYKIPGQDDDDKARVEVEPVRPKRKDQIRRACTTTKLVGKRVSTNFDQAKYQEALAREMVKGWEEINNGGVPFEYSEDNAVLLDANWPEFRELLDAVDDGADAADHLRVEAERGN